MWADRCQDLWNSGEGWQVLEGFLEETALERTLKSSLESQGRVFQARGTK